MVRTRTRVPKGCNPNNLHVIPTASVQSKPGAPLYPEAIVTIPPQPEVENNITVTPTDPVNTKNFYSYKKTKKKRFRMPKRGNGRFATQTFVQNNNTYQWCNPSLSTQVQVPVVDVSQNTDPPQHADLPQQADIPQHTDPPKNTDPPQNVLNNNQPDKENANVEAVPETTPEDFCFEEVEVASSEGESKHIPVGFRKTKLCYLSYKKSSFFRPKFYKLCPQRTVVNCLNVEDNVSVDIVSEAEYDDEPDNELDDPSERLDKIVEIEEENDLDNNMEEEVPKDTEDHVEEEPAKDADDHITEEEVIEEYENQREDFGSDVEIISEDESPKDINNEMEAAQSAKNAGSQKEKKTVNIKVLESSLRTYKTCIKADEGFSQGKSLIQNKLDSWMSHLLGLEYLIEIQNKNGDSVLKYYCVLCCEDLEVAELPEVPLINHINGHKHVMKYLDKHFSSCDYKFDGNGSSDFLSLQKLGEKINESLGYYFMCFTSVDYFVENNEKIKNVIHSAYHPNEDDFKLDKSILQKTVESDLLLDISNILKDCISKIAPEELTITPESESKKCNKDELKSKAVSDPVKTEKIKTKSTVNEEGGAKDKKKSALIGRHKGNNAISSFLRLSFSANKKLPAHQAKKPSKKSKEPIKKTTDCKEEKSMMEIKNAESIEDGKAVKSSKTAGFERSNKTVEAAKPEVMEVTASAEIIDITDSPPFTEVEQSDQMEDVEESDQVVEVEESDQVEEHDQMVEAEELDEGTTEALETLEFDEAVSGAVQHDTNEKACKLKQKVLLKTSLHSKHCRKRILDKESSRLRLATKSSAKDRLVSGVLNKSNVKNKTVVRSLGGDASKNILPVKTELRHVKAVSGSPHKRTPVYKVIAMSTEKAPSSNSELSFTKYPSHHRVVHKKTIEKDKVSVIKDSSSNWKPMKDSASPANSITTSDVSHLSRNTAKKQSRSPVGRIRSPLRVYGSKKAPLRSPARQKSRSPVRRRSKSPLRRKSRSPVRRKSRSPVRRKSRSPIRRKSRSPIRRKSRSPVRRRSRSPYRKHSRSPIRRKSRSPYFRGSRSPVRRKSKSPLRRYSRSPLSRLSRSPFRLRSRSPLRHRSRSPHRLHSRSPLRRRSRSPLRRHSRSPDRNRSRSPHRRHSRSPIHRPAPYASLHKIHSQNAGHFSSSREHKISSEEFSHKRYDFQKRTDSRERKFGSSSKMLSPPRSSMSDQFKSHIFPSSSARGISDLDPVSDEDESLYFTDKHQREDDIVTPNSTKSMLSKLLKKFSVADSNANDPAVNKLMQFMEAHSAEIEELVGAQSTSKSSKVNVPKGESSMQEQNLLLQQILLSNIIGNMQGPVPSVISNLSNLLQTPRFAQPPFIQEPVLPGFRPPLTNVPPPQPLQPVLPPQTIQPRFFPPNINVPPPQIYPPLNQPQPDFPPKPKVPPELMFKDLKATVSKLFGANESIIKQEKKKPQILGYVSEPDPEKWDLNHPETRKFNAAANQKNMLHSPRKNINFNTISESSVSREKMPAFNSNNSNSGQFIGGNSVNRQRIPGLSVPPPDAKVSFCDVPRASSKGNLFPVVSSAQVNPSFSASSSRSSNVSDMKVSLAQRLASVLVKVGMIDVPAPLLQEMLMKIGAFSSSPRQNISESEILSILKRLGYL